MLNDLDKITEHAHKAFQQQARPAGRITKTRECLPEEVKRDYPWRQVPIVTLTHTHTLETKVGQPEYRQFSLLDHMQDPKCLSMRAIHIQVKIEVHQRHTIGALHASAWLVAY